MFLFAIVNIGSEKLLKEEVELKYPELKPSYSRPGFITFKNTDETKALTTKTRLDLVFARIHGLSLGKCNKEELSEKIEKLSEGRIVHKYSPDGTICEGDIPKIGNEVLDIVCISENEFWLGVHTHDRYMWTIPGGKPEITKPENAPSRAYLKIEEAFMWTGHIYKKEEVAIELGSAPGGASFALLERGFKVYGVDTAKMSPICLDNPNFTHISAPMQRIEDGALPNKVDALFCDVNIAPTDTVPQLKRIVEMRPRIKHIFYTMKMGANFTMKDIPWYTNMIRKIGFKVVVATQLPSNNSEIFVYAEK